MFSIINLYHIQNDLMIYISSTVLTYFILILVHLVILIMIAIIRKNDNQNKLKKKMFN
jgi:hypothetical protein